MRPIAILVLISVFSSCQGRQSEEAPKVETKQVNSPRYVTPHTGADTVFSADAPTDMVRKIRRNGDGSLLIASFTQAIHYQDARFSPLKKPEGFPSLDVFDALEDSKGTRWIASTHFGLFHYGLHDTTQFTTDQGLPSNRVMALMEAKDGKIWIATNKGLSRFDGKALQSLTLPQETLGNDVSALMEDHAGRIWVGTRKAPSIYTPESDAFTIVAGKNGQAITNVWAFHQSPDSTVWIGAENGLWRSTAEGFERISSVFTNAITEDDSGNLWTSSPKGTIHQYKIHTLPSEPIEIFRGSSMLFDLEMDDKGNLWFSSIRGVYRYNGSDIHYFAPPANK